MNALAKVSDQHSVEHEFEDIEIELDGLLIGSFFGTAELAMNDPQHGDFYIRHIALKGRRRSKKFRPYGFAYWDYSDGVVHLDPSAPDCRTFKAHLFRALEARLYEDEATKEAWLSEMEDA